jgi:hypothetical protein
MLLLTETNNIKVSYKETYYMLTLHLERKNAGPKKEGKAQ